MHISKTRQHETLCTSCTPMQVNRSLLLGETHILYGIVNLSSSPKGRGVTPSCQSYNQRCRHTDDTLSTLCAESSREHTKMLSQQMPRDRGFQVQFQLRPVHPVTTIPSSLLPPQAQTLRRSPTYPRRPTEHGRGHRQTSC